MSRIVLSFYFLAAIALLPFEGFAQYNENNCYYLSAGRLYNDALHTSPAGGFPALAQCPVYSGVPYFYSYPKTGVGATLCYALGGAYYKVACPIDDYIPLLILATGGFGFIVLQRGNFLYTA